jgi:hypothetical protein
MNLIEQLLVAASAQFLERWGYEYGVTRVSSWAPAAVQAAWVIVLSGMDAEELLQMNKPTSGPSIRS